MCARCRFQNLLIDFTKTASRNQNKRLKGSSKLSPGTEVNRESSTGPKTILPVPSIEAQNRPIPLMRRQMSTSQPTWEIPPLFKVHRLKWLLFPRIKGGTCLLCGTKRCIPSRCRLTRMTTRTQTTSQVRDTSSNSSRTPRPGEPSSPAARATSFCPKSIQKDLMMRNSSQWRFLLTWCAPRYWSPLTKKSRPKS